MRKLLNEELGRLNPDEFREAKKMPVVVVLDNIRSMNNTGSVFRSADAFRVERVVLCGITATPPHREIHKTALGATESVDWEYHADTLKAISLLKQEGYIVCALEQTEESIDLTDFSPSEEHKYALVFGNEMRGVDQAVVDVCDLALEIPQSGTKHSLNISVSAGISLWEFYKRLKYIID